MITGNQFWSVHQENIKKKRNIMVQEIFNWAIDEIKSRIEVISHDPTKADDDGIYRFTYVAYSNCDLSRERGDWEEAIVLLRSAKFNVSFKIDEDDRGSSPDRYTIILSAKPL
jgi:hypothetical protein